MASHTGKSRLPCRLPPSSSRSRWLPTAVAATTAVAPTSAPPPAPKLAPTPPDVHVAKAHVARKTSMLASSTAERLKFEVEYGRRAGTSDNTYILHDEKDEKVALVDVPDDAFAGDFERALGRADVACVLLTRFDPKAARALFSVARRHYNTCDGEPLPVFASKPAADALAEAAEKANAAECVEPVVVKLGDAVDVFGDGTRMLSTVPLPTPRWPYATAFHDATTNVAFTGKFFSTHVEIQSDRDAKVSWEKALPEHRHYFECMLAPVDSHAETALNRLGAKPLADSGYWPLEGLAASSKQGGGINFNQLVRKLTLQGGGTAAAAAAASNEGPRVVAGYRTATARPVALFAPLHGPPSFGYTTQLLDTYRKYTSAAAEQRKACSVGILYASAYGHTASLAQAIARGVQRSGLGIEMVNCEILSASQIDEVMERVEGFAIGSPTLAGNMPTPVATALGRVVSTPGNKTKPCGVFGSFGWSGEAVDLLNDKLMDGGFKSAFKPIRCKFSPTTKMLMTCEESGRALARQVLEKRREEAKKGGRAMPGKESAAPPAFTTPIAQAVGRVIGTLCVVTCRRGDASAALVASWVSQASFAPPGLTIAVKDDRAGEPLLQVGDRFGLSVLAEGAERDALKYFLKSFEPGVDRIAGYSGIKMLRGDEDEKKKKKPPPKKKAEDVDVTPDVDPELDVVEEAQDDEDAFAVLEEAASWCGCVVKSRMECGDHAVMYAEVLVGGLLDNSATPSLHYRKTGMSY